MITIKKRSEKHPPRTLGQKKKKEIVFLRVRHQLKKKQKQTEKENK
jgi:hypothetical protein